MRKIRILITDDEKSARFGMARGLNRIPCDVIEAQDGQQTLDAILAAHPDLVFLDLNMPVFDGHSVLRRLAEQPDANRQCHIYVVTANDGVKSAVERIRLGAVGYITKPYQVEPLLTIAVRVAERLNLQDRVSEFENQQAFDALVDISLPVWAL